MAGAFDTRALKRIQQGSLMKVSIVRELLAFLFENKKWWIGTVVILLLMLGLLIVLTEGSAVAPFIYALF